MKRVVYTVLAGHKEYLNNPFVDVGISSDYDRICFTDNPNLKSEVWSIWLLDSYGLKPELESRRPKILPHRFLDNYDVSLYIDNTVKFKQDPTLIFEQYGQSDSPMVCFKHPWRNCIYEEGEEVIKQGLDKEERVRTQLDFYFEQGFPQEAGLIAGTILLRLHEDPKLIKVSEEWMEHVLHFSKRDQLSFNFVAWHRKFQPQLFEGSLTENSLISWPILPEGKRIPGDFDESTYKWFNPEVVLSPVSARQHYLEEGIKRNLRYHLYRWELNRLANKYKTDKGDLYYNSHGYAMVYEKYLSHLRNSQFILLEIGLLRHDVQAQEATSRYKDVPSLKMWREYFPKASIYGFDIADFSQAPPLNNVKIIRGNVESKHDLENLISQIGSKIDIIIDDASHASHHQQHTLGYLFKFLKPGGYYFIEDLHYQPTSLEVEGIPKTRDILKSMKTGNLVSTPFIGEEDIQYIYKNASLLEFYDSIERKLGSVHQDALVVIQKSKETYSSSSSTAPPVTLELLKEHSQAAQKGTIVSGKKLCVDIGCGSRKATGFVGVDLAPAPGVDIVADLSKAFPFGDSAVDELRAYDVIEHLTDRIHTMNEIWRVCKPGAKVDIRVPSSDGRGAFQDPTHVSFWNINSFKYYCIEFPPYLELCHQYGFKGAFRLLKLDHEQSPNNVVHVNAELEVIKPVPKEGNLSGLPSQAVSSTAAAQLIESPSGIAPSPSSRVQDTADQKTSSALLANVQKYKQNPNDRAAIANLRRERQIFAQEWLELSPLEIEPTYRNSIRQYHQQFLNSGIQQEDLTPTEATFVEEQLAQLATASDGVNYLKHFLPVSVYCPIDQIPLPNHLSLLPEWFLPDYLQILLTVPPHYQRLGDSDRYCIHLYNCIRALHQAVFQDKTLASTSDIITLIAEITNFIPLYFNEQNLKELYVWRSDFLEAFLNQRGYKIDYEFPARPANRSKIRLGILANHFEAAAETFSSLTVYEYVSREFEVILYTLRPLQGVVGSYCRKCANDLKLLPSKLAEQVEVIRADDLDILFVGTNVTAVSNSICFLAAHRLARVQLTSVTSITTTGLRHMDYFLSGELTDPSLDAQNHYRETLIRLPGSVHCFSYGTDAPSISLSIRREDLGIDEHCIIYTSGANFFKCIPELIHTWAKIIAAVPKSVFMLLPFGPNWSSDYPKQAFIHHVTTIFNKYGVESDRILILDPQPVPNREDVKAYFAIADIYLDSYPVCGTTSLMEPLEIGLPVVSRKGSYLRGAMGAAILEAMQLSELVVDNEAAYVQLAVNLGTDSALLSQRQQQVRQQMQSNPPVKDSRRFGEVIGNCFKQLVNKYTACALADSLRLQALNFLVFPDWQAPEEEVLASLAEVIWAIAHHPNRETITLLIDSTGIDAEDANLALSSIAMNLMMEDDAEIYENLQLSLVDRLSQPQWQALLTQVRGRVLLAAENQGAIAFAQADQLPQFTPETLSNVAILEA